MKCSICGYEHLLGRGDMYISAENNKRLCYMCFFELTPKHNLSSYVPVEQEYIKCEQ